MRRDGFIITHQKLTCIWQIKLCYVNASKNISYNAFPAHTSPNKLINKYGCVLIAQISKTLRMN